MNQRHVYIPLDLVIDPKNGPVIKETSRMCAPFPLAAAWAAALPWRLRAPGTPAAPQRRAGAPMAGMRLRRLHMAALIIMLALLINN